MNKTTLTVLLVGVLIMAGGLIAWQSMTPEDHDMANMPDNTANALDGVDITPPPAPIEEVSGTVPGIKEFTIDGDNFDFEPNIMAVKKGDTVRITFKNTGGTHDLKIDEFNVATKQIQGGSQETVEFVADKAGAFEYYCSVGKHRQMGMKGTLTVTE